MWYIDNHKWMSCPILCSTKTRAFFTFYSHTVFATLTFGRHLLLDCTLCANKYWKYMYIMLYHIILFYIYTYTYIYIWHNITYHGDSLTWKQFSKYWRFLKGIDGFPLQRPSNTEFCCVCFYGNMNILLNKWNCRWFEAPKWSCHHF